MRVDRDRSKGNLALENGNCQPSIEDEVDGQTEETSPTFLDKMNAIAYGVEARYELITGHSRRITEETIVVARELGLPEDEIERWAAPRLIHDMEKVGIVESLLKRRQGSPAAMLEMEAFKGNG